QTPGTATYDTGNSASSVGVSQSAGATITASKLLLLGKGTFSLNEANDVGTLAANVNGTISYNDINALTIGTVGTTNGITTSDDDVKLTVLLGGLAINQAVNLGAGDLTLDVRGAAAVTQTATGLITASGLQLLGSGTVNLDQDGNNVVTIAASYNGTISYRDANGLAVGTVTDTAMGTTTTNGITTSDDDVKLTVLLGGLAINQAVNLGAGDLTLDVRGAAAVTQSAAGLITASGLQLLGSGTVNLDQDGNNVVTIAASYNGTISYRDANGLAVGTVTDTAMGTTTTNGITTSDDDVKLTVLLGGLAINQAVNLGAGDLTLDVRGAAAVTQSAAGLITASGLQLLGSGTVNLDQDGNNVVTIAASYNGTISYRDANTLSVGTVTDTAMGTTTTNGITTSDDDVKLTVLLGGLAINQAVNLGAGDLTLDGRGNSSVTQTAIGLITASGLQLLGSGTVNLDQDGNNVVTIAASYNGTISYRDAGTLSVGTVTDTAVGRTTHSGITRRHH